MDVILPFIFWSFATLDRTSGEAHVSANLDTVISNSSDYDGTPVDLYSTRLDLHGELPLGAWGVVATLPLTHVRHQYSGDAENHDILGLGALTLGGYHTFTLPSVGGGALTLRPRLDVVLPTADLEGDYDPGGAREALIFHRLEEQADDSESTWVRGGAVARYDRGPWTAQVDLLVKYAFSERLESEVVLGQKPYFSLGLGVGRQLGPVHATAEFVVANLALDSESPVGSLTTGDVSLGYRCNDLELRGHFGIPLDEYLRTHVLIFGLSASRRL
jgi:hypothetical protein